MPVLPLRNPAPQQCRTLSKCPAAAGDFTAISTAIVSRTAMSPGTGPQLGTGTRIRTGTTVMTTGITIITKVNNRGSAEGSIGLQHQCQWGKLRQRPGLLLSSSSAEDCIITDIPPGQP